MTRATSRCWTSGTTAALPSATAPAAGSVRQRLRRPDGGRRLRDPRRGDRLPPAPWANVIANPRGGFVVTERGAGFTWAENSYFFRLTPWHNDPVSDPPSEACTCATRRAGELWSADAGAASAEDARTPCGTAPAPRRSSTSDDGIATTLTLGWRRTRR